MDTQCNSVDINDLRNFALGIGEVDEVSACRDPSRDRSRSCKQGC